jgi:hypothetical protein
MHHLKSAFFSLTNIYTALATSIFFWLIAYTADANMFGLGVALASGFVAGLLVQNFVSIVVALLLSVVTATICALTASTLWPNYSVSGSVVLAMIVAIWAILIFVLRPISHKVNGKSLLVSMSSVAAVLVALLHNSRSWTSEIAFGALVRNGEDNAAWLVALSHSVVNGHTQLTSASNASGGPGTGVVINVVRQLLDSIGGYPITSNADNGLVLMRAYVFVAVLLAVTWLIAVLVTIQNSDLISNVLFATLTSVISYTFVTGLAKVGHFSAVVAVLFLTTAVYLFFAIGTSRHRILWLRRALIFCALIAAGQSWFPLTALAFFYLVLLVSAIARPYLTQRPSQKTIRIGIVALCALVVFCYVSYTRLFASFLQNAFSLDYVIRNLTIAGGYATVNPWLVVLSFVVVIVWSSSDMRYKEDTSFWILPAVIIAPTTFLFVWSYFLAPFTPQYGAWKYLYITTSVTAPLALVIAGILLPKELSVRFVRAAPVLLLFVFASFTPPWSSIRWADEVKGQDYAWVSAVVRELRETPTRPVGCLNTNKGDTTQDYTGYLCSRMSFGLGGFDDVRHRVWTAGNICTITREQTTFEWPPEQTKNLTVILFDGSRTSTFAGCQAPNGADKNGWLSSIDWSVIRKLDSSGKVVNIPATQPEK